MADLREIITVRRPIAAAFAFAADFSNIEQWDPGVARSVALTSGPAGVGSEYELTVAFGPRRFPMRYRVVAWEPPRRVVLEGAGGGVRARDEISFEQAGEGTRIDYQATLSFDGVPGVAERLMMPVLREVGRRAVAGMKAALDGTGESGKQRSAADRALDAAVLPGVVGFTRAGYAARAAGFRPIERRLAGKTAVVTGATSGLGEATATALLGLGARVVLVGRSPEKAAAVKARLTAAGDEDRVRVALADLSSIRETRALGERLSAEHGAIDILVNNAGALFDERAETNEGLERTFALDLLSPFTLTEALRGALIRAAPSRVVNVSSGGMYTQRLRVDDLQNQRGAFDGAVAYARAKRGLVVLTEMWAQRFEGTGVAVNAMHPGWADTPGVATSLPGFYRATRRALRTPAEGADTIVWLAAARETESETGKFWLDREPRSAYALPGTRERPEERAALWEALGRIEAEVLGAPG